MTLKFLTWLLALTRTMCFSVLNSIFGLNQNRLRLISFRLLGNCLRLIKHADFLLLNMVNRFPSWRYPLARTFHESTLYIQYRRSKVLVWHTRWEWLIIVVLHRWCTASRIIWSNKEWIHYTTGSNHFELNLFHSNRIRTSVRNSQSWGPIQMG